MSTTTAFQICYYCNDPFSSDHLLKLHVKRIHHITDPSQINPALQDLYQLGLLPRPQARKGRYRLQQWFRAEEGGQGGAAGAG